ncbi:hypothetical protein [Chryseobacterium daeguense]|uniref:hypothetical protein n=1 Tax=Chryseobacterium daeguense TaxID=412438 RepID=UPI0003FD0738|nr:hypothetical protein [Chryseobacterium daeguense]
MSTDKNILQKMSSQELEKYIQPESRYTQEAMQYAYEILQSRGKEFSEEEKGRIQSLIHSTKEAEKVIHPNHIKAADLMYISGAVGVGGIIWKYELLNSLLFIFVAVGTVAFIFGMGYLISKGNNWLKYLLAGLFVLGLFSLPEVIFNIKADPVLAIINIVQTVLQAWTIILLFQIPKNN